MSHEDQLQETNGRLIDVLKDVIIVGVAIICISAVVALIFEVI